MSQKPKPVKKKPEQAAEKLPRSPHVHKVVISRLTVDQHYAISELRKKGVKIYWSVDDDGQVNIKYEL